MPRRATRASGRVVDEAASGEAEVEAAVAFDEAALADAAGAGAAPAEEEAPRVAAAARDELLLKRGMKCLVDGDDDPIECIIYSILQSGTVIKIKNTKGEEFDDTLSKEDATAAVHWWRELYWEQSEDDRAAAEAEAAAAPQSSKASKKPKPTKHTPKTVLVDEDEAHAPPNVVRVLFTLKDADVSEGLIKASEVFCTETVDFSRLVAHYGSEARPFGDSASKFRAELCANMSRVIIVDDKPVEYRFTVSSVYDATATKKGRGKLPAGEEKPPHKLDKFLNAMAFIGALKDDRPERIMVVMGSFEPRTSAPELAGSDTSEEVPEETPTGSKLSLIHVTYHERKKKTKACDVSPVAIGRGSARPVDADRRNDDHGGNAGKKGKKSRGGGGGGGGHCGGGGGTKDGAAPISLRGMQFIPPELITDSTYGELYQQALLLRASMDTTHRHLWSQMDVLATMGAKKKMTQTDYGKLSQLMPFEVRCDQVHAIMRHLDGWS